MSFFEAIKWNGPSWPVQKKRISSSNISGGVDLTTAPLDGERIIIDDLYITTDANEEFTITNATSGTEVHGDFLLARTPYRIKPTDFLFGNTDEKLEIATTGTANIRITCLYHSGLIPSVINLSEGLTFYIPLDGDLDEKSGTGLTLTNVNSATFGTGNGQTSAISLDRTSEQYLKHADNSAFEPGNSSVTFTAWAKLTGKGSTSNFNKPAVLSKWKAGPGVNKRTYRIDVRPDSNVSSWTASSDGSSTDRVNASLTGQPDSDWHFYRVDWDKDNNLLTIRIDESVVATKAHSGGFDNNDADFFIGGIESTDAGKVIQHWDGLIQGVGSWNRVLNDAEGQFLLDNPGIKHTEF